MPKEPSRGLATSASQDPPNPLLLLLLSVQIFWVVLSRTLKVRIGTSCGIWADVGIISIIPRSLLRSGTCQLSPLSKFLPTSSQGTFKSNGVLWGVIVGCTFISRTLFFLAGLSCCVPSSCNGIFVSRLSCDVFSFACRFSSTALKILVCRTHTGAVFFFHSCLRWIKGCGLSNLFLFLPFLTYSDNPCWVCSDNRRFF